MSAHAKKKVLDGHIKLLEHGQVTYFVRFEDETTIKDVLDPSFWAHVAARIEPNSVINIHFKNDENAYCSFLVIDKDRLWLKLALLYSAKLQQAESAPVAPIEAPSKGKPEAGQNEKAENNGSGAFGYVQFVQGGTKKWCVFRSSDKERIAEGFANRVEAEIKLAELEKRING